ncbi:MAG: hypothetical protein HYT80_09490 [Euryarchaeota archaeon]|nr:hypothetical protein [Euryarchaeota archaeon]
MDRRPFALICILVTAALAGCAEKATVTDVGPQLPGAPAPQGGGAAPANPGERPTWTHGDWFEIGIKVDLGFGTLVDGKHKIVVGAADTGGYELSASTRDVGIVDAHFNDFYVGHVDPNLNGHTGSEGAMGKTYTLFDWPLDAGKIWAAEIIEDPLGEAGYVKTQFAAGELTQVPDPHGTSPGLTVLGKTANGYFVNYTYSSAVKWLTKYEKRTPQGRIMTYFELTDYGTNYTGDFHKVTKAPLYERFILNPFWVFDTSVGPVPPAEQFAVNTDFSFLQEISFLFTYALPPDPPAPRVDGPGLFHYEVVFPDNTHREQTLSGVGDKFDFFFKNHEPYKKGTYSVGYATAGFSGAFVGYYAFTDVVTTFGKASHAHH